VGEIGLLVPVCGVFRDYRTWFITCTCPPTAASSPLLSAERTVFAFSGLRIGRKLRGRRLRGFEHRYRFRPIRRLAAVAHDGFIRLYDKEFQRIAKVETPGGKHPSMVAFSPDATRLVVGYETAPPSTC
jgi:hypothetical protein